MLKVEFRAMGCQMAAFVDRDTTPAARMLQQTPQWFEDWEQALSRFRPDSELNQLNASAGQPFAASPVLWEAVQLALRAADGSGGLVVPTALKPLERAGYDRSFELVKAAGSGPSPQAEDSSLLSELGAWREIEMDEDHRTITLPPGTKLDLGGSAKGWAAQQAAARLAAAGPALVDAAGDIAASGMMEDGSPWLLDVADPLEMSDRLAQVALPGGGAATSGIDRRRWQQGGRWQHHIIDPRSGRPAETDLLSVTVIAPGVTWAETAAKMVLILGSRAGLAWLESRPELAGLLALPDGQILYCQNMHAYLWSEYVA